MRAVVVSSAPAAGFPAGFPLFEGRFFGGWSCRVLLFLGWPDLLQQPVHHWHSVISNLWAVQILSYFQSLVQNRTWEASGFWNSECENNPKNNRGSLPLTLGTIMRASSSHHEPPDRSPAPQAWLTGTHIDAMLQLKEPAYPIRIHIIRNR
jgi:hypothetical protein